MRGLIAIALICGLAAGVVSGVFAQLLLDDDNGGSGGNGDDVSLQALAEAAAESAVSRAVGELDAQVPSRDELIAEVAAQVADQLSLRVSERIIPAYRRASPSVVVIDAEGAEQTRDDGVSFVPAALATGIVLDDRGHIVTAAHVLDGVETVEIVLPDGERRPAVIVGSDAPFSDIAVIRVDGDGLIAAAFGESADLEAGEPVLAIGNILLGSEIAVTAGVVSDPDTAFFRQRYIQEHLIQTDAALNHGNSGGALVTLDGAVIGMTAVIARETQDGDFVDGVGFALQIDTVLEIARAIVAQGFYPRPSFGVVNERLLTPSAAQQLELAISRGAFILELRRNSVFAEAGVRPGDVIRELDGFEVSPDMPYLNILAGLEPGRPVEVVIHRDGRDSRLTVAPELRRP